jgi:hypothetical protein
MAEKHRTVTFNPPVPRMMGPVLQYVQQQVLTHNMGTIHHVEANNAFILHMAVSDSDNRACKDLASFRATEIWLILRDMEDSSE